MNIAYFVNAHAGPDQLAILMAALHRPQDLFLVHVDARTPDDMAQRLADACPKAANVILMPRRSIRWGGWSLCAVEREAMRIALAHSTPWQYFANLSGTDLPAMPTAEMDAILRADPTLNYVQLKDVRRQSVHHRRHIRRRLRWFCLEGPDRLRRLPMPRPLPWGVDWDWYGSMWHHLTRDFCAWLISDPKADRIQRFLRHTKIPDETWIQVLIMNGPFRQTAAPAYRRFVKWEENRAHPETLTMRHLDEIRRSGAFFARKFDPAVDAQVMEALLRAVIVPAVPRAAADRRRASPVGA